MNAEAAVSATNTHYVAGASGPKKYKHEDKGLALKEFTDFRKALIMN